MVYQAYIDKKHIFIAGNGGSASLSSHMACDIMKSCKDPVRVISLTDNVATITAIANDYSYDHIFQARLAELVDKGDLCIGISASGVAQNIVNFIKMGVQRLCPTVMLTGNAGDANERPLHRLALRRVIVDSDNYGIVEDIHTSIMHIMCCHLRERTGVI